MNITWKEFKDLVEKQMHEKGISEDTPIWYIDISMLWRPELINVFVKEYSDGKKEMGIN